jgi:hypothetical protein
LKNEIAAATTTYLDDGKVQAELRTIASSLQSELLCVEKDFS